MNNNSLICSVASDITKTWREHVNNKIKKLIDEVNLSEQEIFMAIHISIINIISSDIGKPAIENELICEEYVRNLSIELLRHFKALRERITAENKQGPLQ